MSNGEHEHGELPVRAAETVAAVVAALAIEQIAQGTLIRIYDMPQPVGILQVLFRIVLPVALVVTTVRFVHGNVLHLALQYRRWHHREVPRDSLVATPISHYFDVLFHLLQYLCLVAAGTFLAKDLKLVGIAVGVLFLLDLAWLGVFMALNRGAAAKQSRTTHKSWLTINALSLLFVGGVVAFWYMQPARAPEFEMVLAVGIILAAIIDYSYNYEHFFGQGITQSSVELAQASAVVQYVTALLPLTQATRGPVIPQRTQDEERDALRKLLLWHFQYFMQDSGNRAQLFRRASGAKLHVGIYIEEDNYLIPIFRYVDRDISLSNSRIRVGSGYVGRGYAMLSADSTEVHFYPRPDLQWSLPGRENDSSLQHYKSALVTDVFWSPPGGKREPIGVLLITADKEDYFVGNIHEAMLLGVNRILSISLYRHFGKKDAKEVKKELLNLGQTTIVEEVLKKPKKK